MTQSAATAGNREQAATTAAVAPAPRWAPLTGIAFVVFFIGGVTASTVPGDSASQAAWVAAYTGSGKQASHIVTGVLLVLAGLSLMSFLAALWARIGRLRQRGEHSAVPLVAAGVAAACMSAGGVLMGSGSTVARGFATADPAATAVLVRFANDAGFAMTGIAGMLAAALSVAGLSVQAYRCGMFGRRMEVFGMVVAVILLASVEFLPIAALLVWLVITAIVLIRAPAASVPE